MKKWIILILIIFSLTSIIIAQDETEDYSHLRSAWTVVDVNAMEGDEAITDYVAFLWIDDNTILEVWSGEDVLYTLDDEGEYTGSMLIPAPYDHSATLTVIDENTIETMSVTDIGSISIENHLRYERTDIEIGIWTEVNRNLTEYSMFADCMGRMNVAPPVIFAFPDPIVAIAIDEDAGEMALGPHLLIGDGTAFELEEEGELGQFVQEITWEASVSEDLIELDFYAIADGRDDCEVRYDTQFVPFDGDFEAFFTYAEEIAEASQE